jgi:2-phosphosulfolactate phosphatase
MPSVTIHLLPSLIYPAASPDFTGEGRLKGSSAVVIDVLRATTTIIHALAAGAERIIPLDSIDRARQVHRSLPFEGALMGGERHGVKIEGFNLDNSPFSYTPEVVRGKTILFTTTNGTRALATARGAERILIGALVNRSALSRVLLEEDRNVNLICAGTDGVITAEDCLFAGLVAGDLLTAGEYQLEQDAGTWMAYEFAQTRGRSADGILKVLRESRGGQNLLDLGFDADVERSAAMDLFDFVPEWDPATGTIIRSKANGADEQFAI